MRDAEIPLSGGNMYPVVRIGDTVRRITGEWTPAVHRLLRAYESAGITETPRAQGIDEQGREVLSHLDGAPLVDQAADVQWDPGMLRAAARLLRRLHDASTPLVEADLTWRSPSREPVEVICHGDFATYNLLVSEGRLSGVIDVDFAGPAPRLWDLSYLAYRMVPYAEDAVAFDPVRHGTTEERLATLIEAYGIRYPSDAVRDAIAGRLAWLAAFTEPRADETGRTDLREHAAMYRRDAARLSR